MSVVQKKSFAKNLQANEIKEIKITILQIC